MVWRQSAKVIGATAGVGIAGGALFHLGGIPLAWMLGSLVAVAAAGLFWFPTQIPSQSRQFGQVIAGVVIGLYFTPDFAATLLPDFPLMLLAAVCSIAAGIAVAMIVARISGIDRTTAYFASLPGGVAEMAVLADRFGGDTALVAMSQSFRIIIVVMTVPVAIFYFGRPGILDSNIHAAESNLPLLVLMLAIGSVLAGGLGRLQVTNNWLLGGLIVGASAAFWELPHSSVPVLVVILSQLLIGCALGARITRKSVAAGRRFIPLTIMGTVMLLAFTVVMAAMLSLETDISFETVALGAAPGGAAETSLTARSLHLNVGAVSAFHLVRILMIVLFSAPVYQIAARLGHWRKARRTTMTD